MGDALRVACNGFGKGLINGLVESSDIFDDICIDNHGHLFPEAQDSRTDRAIFCGQLDEIKANKLSQNSMRGGRCLARIGFRQSLRLDMSLVLSLRLTQV